MQQAGSQLTRALDVAILSPGQHQQFRTAAASFALTRASSDEPWSIRDAGASGADPTVYVTLSDNQTVRLNWNGWPSDGELVESSGELTDSLPLRVSLGNTWIEIAAADPRRKPEQLAHDRSAAAEPRSLDRGPSTITLARWFEALTKLHRWPASSHEFFEEATRFVVEILGLDGAIILLVRDHDWTIESSHLPHPGLGILCDVGILEQLSDSPTTRFETASCMSAEQEQAVVVSPLLDESRQLIGALYAYRAPHDGNARRGIRYLEAYLIELLANSISHSISRLEKEKTAALKRAFLEQAFGVAVAHELERNPECLSGREREVTILFADLRDFSTLCSSLDIRLAYEVLNDVMDCLTYAVMDEGGVVLDYYGDGLAAMWNAPVDQPNHPELACRAGLAMLERLPEVAEHWTRVLEGTLRLGVGIHTGLAQVGNVGSTRRLKYGARGTTVNLTSRVEAATKLIGLPILITGETAARLTGDMKSNRVCQAKLPGMPDSVELHAISATVDEPTTTAWMTYHEALELFGKGDLDKAQQQLEQLPEELGSIPQKFLKREIGQLQNQKHGRRSKDRTTAKDSPVIELQTK